MLAASMDLEKLLPEIDPAVLEMLTGMVGAILAVVLAVAVVAYVLNSIGIYSISKRRGFYRPWLAWLPLCRDWVLGAIADRYQLARWHHITISGPSLVIMKIIAYVLNITTLAAFQKLLQSAEKLMSWSGKKVTEWQYQLYIMPWEQQMISTRSFLNIVGILALMVTLIYVFLYFRARHDLFASCRPDLKVVFLVLGILFPVTMPFFVFACRKHDLGIQPKEGEEESPPQVFG